VEPWRAKLAAREFEAAWDLFIDRYRRLILATIRRMVEEDDVADVFGHVCQALSADRLQLLTRYREDRERRARFSTWLVTVVHNQVVDWLRRRRGRRRVRAPRALSTLQEQIFTCVFVERRSHAETYEAVRAAMPADFSFPDYLKELAETYRVVERARPRGVMHYFSAVPALERVEANADDVVGAAEIRRRLAPALDTLAAEERVALQLYVVQGTPAADVARILGWPNAKAVYNRVYRALQSVRAVLERDGIGPADL
jgi:RNA polymerase sigma factor (sigma-70 family)